MSLNRLLKIERFRSRAALNVKVLEEFVDVLLEKEILD